MSELPRIVYIAGYGRSGSTLLDALLDAHPAIAGVGEIANVLRPGHATNLCTCGSELADCEMWGPVLLRPPVRELAAGQREAWADAWRTIFTSVGARTGADVVVDSTKSGRGDRLRPLLLRRAGFDVRVVHLVRDPRAVTWSVARGGNRAIEAGSATTGVSRYLRGIAGWLLANVTAEVLTNAAFRGRDRSIRVRYEDLVDDHRGVVQAVCSFAGVDPTQLPPEAGETAGHAVSGNRMRRSGSLRVRADTEWETALPRMARVLCLVTVPLAHRYGYRLLGSRR